MIQSSLRLERMGHGNDYIDDDSDDDSDDEENNTINNNNNTNKVHEMNCFEFRKKLIENFSILFENNEIKWPTRNGVVEPNI